MQTHLEMLLRSLVDYAGLFPPASLSLEETLERYAGYLTDPDAPMLGRLILPISKFDEAKKVWQETGREDPIRVSALLPRTVDIGDFRQKLPDLLSAVKKAIEDSSYPIKPEVLEISLPDAFADAVQETELGAIIQMLEAEFDHLELALPVFLEPPLSGDFPLVADGMTAVLAQHNLNAEGDRYGWKLRCGGLHAAAFPSSETLARVLTAAGRHGVPLKATAGLHHPFPIQDETVNARMHGFVNLLVATALAFRSESDRSQIAAVLDEDDAKAFQLAPKLAWRELVFEDGELSRLRSEGLTSFGSCSFDEPRDDLRAIGAKIEFN